MHIDLFMFRAETKGQSGRGEVRRGHRHESENTGTPQNAIVRCMFLFDEDGSEIKMIYSF